MSESSNRARGHGLVARHQIAEHVVPPAQVVQLNRDKPSPDEYVAALFFAASAKGTGLEPPSLDQPFVKVGGWRADGKRGYFDRMFPGLTALDIDLARLEGLAQSMQDTFNEVLDNETLPAGYTYLGQFIDHDLSLDLTPLSEKIKDPSMTRNYRTPRLDLDSLYGDGPEAHRFLYQRDRLKFAIGVTNKLGNQQSIDEGLTDLPNDLPRSPDGIALLGDHRNDENLIVAQTHLAFLKFHNKVIDLVNASGKEPHAVFLHASKLVRWHFQWIVLHDFVKRITAPGVVDDVLATKRLFYTDTSFVPLEFSGAAYRLGHSLVRSIYDFNRIFDEADLVSLFDNTGMLGTIKRLASSWAIDWRRFYDVEIAGGPPVNFARRFAPLLSSSLQSLSIPAATSHERSLAFRNLSRGCQLQLPSGQAIANEMRKQLPALDVLSEEEIGSGKGGDAAKEYGVTKETPLWYYILKEAEVKGDDGRHLGPMGSRIVAEVFVGLLEASDSYLKEPGWTPTLPAKDPSTFTMADLLNFVGDLNPVGD